MDGTAALGRDAVEKRAVVLQISKAWLGFWEGHLRNLVYHEPAR